MRWWTAPMAAMVVAAAPIAVSSADPVAPQPDASCSPDLTNALTLPAGARIPLRCADGTWLRVTDPYPFSDRWVSSGPTMTLSGGARQNPDLDPGEWTATPLTAGDRCRAEQVSVTYGKVDGPPRVDEGGTGERLALEVIPRLLDIEMSGNCLWQKVGD